MKLKDYQTPNLLTLMLNDQDVIRTSDWVGESEANTFDKGVDDFFSE